MPISIAQHRPLAHYSLILPQLPGPVLRALCFSANWGERPKY